MNPIDQATPAPESLTQKAYSPREWLTMYRNVWTRNLVARTIDIQNDMLLKKKNPDMMVEHEGGAVLVKQRLEERKIYVQDALNIIASIDSLLAEEGSCEALWTPEALMIEADALPE